MIAADAADRGFPPRSTYLPAIDGLRAFAVLAVLLFHADHMSGGFLGVDAFFVVSGFLITRQMLQEVDRSGKVSLRAFWARRARRILPAVLLLLLVVTTVAYRFGFAGERFKIHEDAPWALGFALNWHHIAASSDYWALQSSPSPLVHLWSLAVEEQFYVVWPLLTVLLVRIARRREVSVVVGSAVLALASFVLMAVVFDPQSTTRAYEGTDARIGALLIGALCATTFVTDAAARAATRLGRGLDALLLLPVVVLGWMWLRVDGRDAWLYRGGFALHAALVSIVLLLVCSRPGSSRLARLLELDGVRWVGKLSYGLYLWHWPIYVALSPGRVDIGRWPLTALRIALTFVFAAASYYVVENPARHGLQRRPLPQTAFASIAGIAVVVAAVAVVPLPPSEPAPINIGALAVPPVTSPATTASSTPTTAPATTTTAATPSTTTPSDSTPSGSTPSGSTTTTTTEPSTTTTAPPPTDEVHKVLWLGDSVAFTTTPGVYAALQAVGVTLYDGSFPGVGTLNETGPAFFEQLTERLAGFGPDLVVMQMSTWDEPFGADAIHDALARVRDLVVGSGAHLLVYPVPPMRADQDHDGFPNDRAAAERLAEEDPSNVTFLDTRPFWGTTFEYDMDGDKVPERLGDGVHLCPSGSAKFAIWFITQLTSRYANLSVADPASWAVGDWTQDSRYDRVNGGCSLLP